MTVVLADMSKLLPSAWVPVINFKKFVFNYYTTFDDYLMLHLDDFAILIRQNFQAHIKNH